MRTDHFAHPLQLSPAVGSAESGDVTARTDDHGLSVPVPMVEVAHEEVAVVEAERASPVKSAAFVTTAAIRELRVSYSILGR